MAAAKIGVIDSKKLPTDEEKAIAFHVLEPVDPSDCDTYILLPSMGDLRHEFRYLWELLHDSGRNRVVCTDLRGMGDSDTTFCSYTPDDTGRDLLKLMRHIGGASFILVGCSMSAASVVYAAAEEPSKVKGMIFISPFIWDHKMPFGVPTLLSLLLNSCTGPSFWTDYYKSLYTMKEKPVHDMDEYAVRLKSNLCESGRISVLRGHIFASKETCSAKITDVCGGGGVHAVPAYAVYGSKDPDFPDPTKELAELSARFPQLSSSLMIENAGHYPHVEDPQKVYEGISAFVASLK